MRAMAGTLREQLEDFAKVESMDCGKPLTESRADIEMCADVLEYYADLAPAKLAPDKLDTPDADYHAQIIKEPVGVAGLVTPWNFPLMQAVLKVAPAMAAGCTMVLKPSPWASLTCVMLGDVLRTAGAPPGVVNSGSQGGKIAGFTDKLTKC